MAFQESRSETLIRRVKSGITKHGLFSAGEHVLVGVSGGADSVCLLFVLNALAPSLRLQLTAAHLNHGIRKPGAAKDEAFVGELAARLGVRLVTQRVHVPRRARNAGVSLEMAAREARYTFFSHWARRTGATTVATAHTADDQAETVLLKLARGAGPTGLSGIARETVLRGWRIVRPLLDFSHDEICAFLRSQGVGWREDETNRDVTFLRNRVRHDILPLLEKNLNPAIRQSLIRTAEILAAEDRWLTEISREALRDCRSSVHGALSVSRLNVYRLAARRRVLMLWLREEGVPADRVDFDLIERLNALLAGRTGGRTRVGASLVVTRSYDHLVVAESPSPEGDVNFRKPLPVPGEISLPEVGICFRATLGPGVERPRGGKPGDLPARASISKRAVGRKRLYIRFRRTGDRIKPMGMRGSRKLQDIFVDAKVPRACRSRIPVVECGGEIIWIPGYRVARGWDVRPSEKNAIQICADGI